ncbi:hypothetical protein WME79_10285 [Sorangium sp. So ce726]
MREAAPMREEGYRLLYGQAVEDIRAFLDGKVLRPLNQLPVDPTLLG